MDYETIFRYTGMLLCLGASAYLILKSNKKIGALFFVSFILQFQSGLYVEYIGYPDDTGECWAMVQDFYKCLPLSFKLSIHSAQAGLYLMAFSVFQAARAIGKRS